MKIINYISFFILTFISFQVLSENESPLNIGFDSKTTLSINGDLIRTKANGDIVTINGEGDISTLSKNGDVTIVSKYGNVTKITGNMVSTSYKTNSVSIHDKETMDHLKESMGFEDGSLSQSLFVFMIKAENSTFEKIIKSLISFCFILFAFFFFFLFILMISLSFFLVVVVKMSLFYALFISVFFVISIIVKNYWQNNNKGNPKT
jgi:hypothetical protein